MADLDLNSEARATGSRSIDSQQSAQALMPRERQLARQPSRCDARREPDPERRMRRRHPSRRAKQGMLLSPSTLAPEASILLLFLESPRPGELPIFGRWPDAVRFWSGIASFHLQTRPDPADGSPDFPAACVRVNYAALAALGEALANVAAANALSF